MPNCIIAGKNSIYFIKTKLSALFYFVSSYQPTYRRKVKQSRCCPQNLIEIGEYVVLPPYRKPFIGYQKFCNYKGKQKQIYQPSIYLIHFF